MCIRDQLCVAAKIAFCLRRWDCANQKGAKMHDANEGPLAAYLSRAATASTPAEAAALCVEATGDNDLHVFGELLDCSSIASLREAGIEFKRAYDLLTLFAYGTYKEYASNVSNFPALSTAHIRKLRRLSVVSLAIRHNVVSYTQLRTELGLEAVRDVEDAVLDAIYAGLLRARLDQRAELVEVISAAGRDVLTPVRIHDMYAILQDWAKSAEKIVDKIDYNLEQMQTANALAAKERASVAAAAQAVKDDISAHAGGRSGFRRATSREAEQAASHRQMLRSGRSIRSRV